MAITVVLDHPRRHLRRRAWRQFGAFWGGALLVVGVIASLVVLPTTIAVVSFVVGWLSDEPKPGEEPWPPPDMPVNRIILAWAVSTPIAIVCFRFGLRLLRGRRGLLLFLRRFGYEDATRAVTFAAAKTVGGSWRLVTLDDAEIAPLGIPARTKRLFDALWRVTSSVPRLSEFVFTRALPFTLVAMATVIGLELLQAPDWRAALPWEDPRYTAPLDSLTEHRIPIDAIEWSLPGAFALFAILFLLALAAGFATFALTLLVFPLAPVFLFLSASSQAADEAEAAATQAINDVADIRLATTVVAKASRKVFAPRLVVLRVASPVWQQTVQGFADVCSAPLIDLSDVSENVLWEIEELTRRFGPSCLFVGLHDRVAWLAGPSAADPGSNEERLLRLLDGHEVLAYTTDRPGVRRFARSLRAKLLTVTG